MTVSSLVDEALNKMRPNANRHHIWLVCIYMKRNVINTATMIPQEDQALLGRRYLSVTTSYYGKAVHRIGCTCRCSQPDRSMFLKLDLGKRGTVSCIKYYNNHVRCSECVQSNVTFMLMIMAIMMI